MSVKSPTHASAELPPGVQPSLEMNEVLIKKFLKSCKKEDLQKKVFDKSAGVRRFETPRQKERRERRIAKERALREAREAEKLSLDDKQVRRKQTKKQ
jgi:hypothetical protein